MTLEHAVGPWRRGHDSSSSSSSPRRRRRHTGYWCLILWMSLVIVMEWIFACTSWRLQQLIFGSPQEEGHHRSFLPSSDLAVLLSIRATNDSSSTTTSSTKHDSNQDRDDSSLEPFSSENKSFPGMVEAISTITPPHASTTTIKTTATGNGNYRIQNVNARDGNGQVNYVADPQALKKGLQDFWETTNKENYPSTREKSLFFAAMDHYHPLPPTPTQLHDKMNDTTKNLQKNVEYHFAPFLMDPTTGTGTTPRDDSSVGWQTVTCSLGPGRGMEQDAGYKLWREKIVPFYDPSQNQQQQQQQPSVPKNVKLFCGMYTHRPMFALARSQALAWGWQCDGFLAFSTTTLAALGMVELIHPGPESYRNMWQKIQSIWTYTYHHYLNDYDFFHLGGDDMYVLVSHLKQMLSEKLRQHQRYNSTTISSTDQQDVDHDDDGFELFLGQLVPHKGNVLSGGPGYTLSRRVLKRLIEQALPQCALTHRSTAAEDVMLSKCLAHIGILPSDSRDVQGEQTYHNANPSLLYTFRSTTGSQKRSSLQSQMARDWEQMPHPIQPKSNNDTALAVLVGPKHGMDAASRHSVSFHDIYHPLFVTRLHAMLPLPDNNNMNCPPDSPLALGLLQHYHSEIYS